MPSLPPNEKTSEWLTIRIHKNPKDSNYQTFCERQFDSFISCYETHSNRPHVHMLVKKKVTRSKQIADLMKKMFHFNGNTDFSVKNVNPTPEDLLEVSKYHCKGDSKTTQPCVVFRSHDWTDAKIKDLHEQYYQNGHIDQYVDNTTEHVQIDLNTVEVEKKKIKRKTWTEKIIDELISDYEDTPWDWNNVKHKQFMLQYVLKKLGDTRKIFNEHKIKEFVYACFNSLDAKNFRSDIELKVMPLLK